jgi:Uma2 family endonuclease
MVAIIADPDVERRLLAERRRLGLDRFDEVWDGVYFMSPAPNNEHQGLGGELTAIFIELVTWKRKGRIFPSCNISADEDWTQNYRIPDVAVFLKGNSARDMGTHWNGGPDLTVEILSPDDRSWEKLPFYAALGTREILLIDRDPWRLAVCRLDGKEIRPQEQCSLAAGGTVQTQTVPLSWQLITHSGRPALQIRTLDGTQQWLVEARGEAGFEEELE